MTKLILSTGNIVSGGPSIIRKPGAYRSNLELTNSLRSNFLAAQQAAAAGLEHATEGANGVSAASAAAIGEGGAVAAAATAPATNGVVGSKRRPPLAAWTQRSGSVLYVPRLDHDDWDDEGATKIQGNGNAAAPPRPASESESETATPPREDSIVGARGLQEEASQYETTAKLFFLAGTCGASMAERGALAAEALDLVFRELGVSSVDLLVVSFPGIVSTEEYRRQLGDCGGSGVKAANGVNGTDKVHSTNGTNGTSGTNGTKNTNGAHRDCGQEELAAAPPTEPSDSLLLDDMAATWAATAEALHAQGKARRLGVAEFGEEMLARFLKRVQVKPTVDQVNLRSCCSVPKGLVVLAREQGIELLVHTDCTDVLPPGTLRELLGQGLQGAGVLAEAESAAGAEPGLAETAEGLRGDLTPQWVVKYTAVVRDRGVIENKGYFAGAALQDV